MNKPSTRAKAWAHAEIAGIACGDYKELASSLYESLIQGLENWNSGLTEADIQGMPNGYDCPRQFLAWWKGELV